MVSKSRKKPARPAKKIIHRTRKAVPVKPEDVSESCLQMHSADWLREAHPGLLAFHVANERQAKVQYHVKLKQAGVLAGVADWLLFPPGRAVAVELKDAEGTQEPEQEAFEQRWTAAGHAYYLCRTLEGFKQLVDAIMLFG